MGYRDAWSVRINKIILRTVELPGICGIAKLLLSALLVENVML